MTNIRAGAFLLIGVAALGGLYMWDKRKDTVLSEEAIVQNIEDFRKNAEERLRGPEGWLSVVGLTWLKEGTNTLGSSRSSNVILPSSVPAMLGSIQYQNGKGILKLASADNVLINDQPATVKSETLLLDDADQDPTKVKVGAVTFFLIKRKNGVGVRVKDPNSETRTNFKGRVWYPAKKEYVIDAEWVAHPTPKTIKVPDILGNVNDETSPGFARFTLDGETVELHPTQEGDDLFYVFRDQTSGKETYGAARFLYSSAPKDGHVQLDFNRAVNPPCAFTHFATCPMPPKENILKVAIRAGELKQPGSDH